MDDKRNQFTECEEELLREQVKDAARKMKREAVAVFQCHVEQFQELLWGLIYLYSGQPARAP